jgi:uncharacterized phage protein (TIGR02218 family)
MSNAQVYLTSSGYEFTGIQSSTSTSPAVFDFEGIAGMAGIDRNTVASGVFDGARCYLFAVNWLSPVEDYEPIIASILGKTTLIDDRYKIEEMALIDALNQSIGKTYSASCPKVFGGTEYAGCKKDLGGLTVSGAVTSVSNQYTFGDSSRGEAADYWIYGTVDFTSGLNASLKPMEIRSFSAGVITVFDAFYYQPQVGDTYLIRPGCRKTLSDCRDKWNNVINFGGFSNMPTSSIYSSRGTR